jgi:hypothetical protein
VWLDMIIGYLHPMIAKAAAARMSEVADDVQPL